MKRKILIGAVAIGIFFIFSAPETSLFLLMKVALTLLIVAAWAVGLRLLILTAKMLITDSAKLPRYFKILKKKIAR